MWLATFHSLCARLLRAEISQIERPTDFIIYDQSDQLSVVRQIVAELAINEDLYPPARLLAAISRAKNDGLSPETLPQAA